MDKLCPFGHNLSMSVVTVAAWHCDVCGYEWLKASKPPIRCANPKCRSRNWNSGEPTRTVSGIQHGNPVTKPLSISNAAVNWDAVYTKTKAPK